MLVKFLTPAKMRFLVSWLHYLAQLRIMPAMFLTIDPLCDRNTALRCSHMTQHF